MAKSVSAKWFCSTMQGAPGLVNSIAGLQAVLDACLVNGFNSLTLTGITVSNGIATATRSLGHGYPLDSVVLIAGATPSGLNGEKRVMSVGSTWFTFDAEGISDGAATGTITAKIAPAGWSLAFTGTNKRVYRSQNANSPKSYYRITADAQGYGLIQAYEGMTDVDTGTNLWTDGNQIMQYPALGGWQVWADDRTFYMMTANSSYSGWTYMLSAMGDFTSFSSNDQAEIVMGNYALPFANSGSPSRASIFQSSATTFPQYTRLHRSGTGELGCTAYGFRQVNDASGYSGPSFPSPVDNGLMLSDAIIIENGNGFPLRGRMRGSYWVLANQPMQTVWPAQTIEGVSGLEGRTISMAWFSRPNTGTFDGTVGRAAIDVTGPWE